VIKEYYQLARIYSEQTIKEIQKLETKLSDRYLLSLHIIYNLYKQVFDRINIEKGSFTSIELNPSPMEIKDKVLEITSTWQTIR
jgi:hypothetical protein